MSQLVENIVKREQAEQSRGILGQPTIAHLAIPVQVLHHVERMQGDRPRLVLLTLVSPRAASHGGPAARCHRSPSVKPMSEARFRCSLRADSGQNNEEPLTSPQ